MTIAIPVAELPRRLFLQPARPYPWRYGEAPPGLLARRRAFAPGEQVQFRFALPPGLRAAAAARLDVRLTLADGKGRALADLGAGTVTAAPEGIAGTITLSVPGAQAAGTYVVEARLAPGGGGAEVVRRETVLVAPEQPALRRAAEQALARAAAAPLDETARTVSLPSVEMLVEDADIVWHDFVDPERDWAFVARQLRAAAAFADRLAAGDDPYRRETGLMVKAIRSPADGTLQPYGLRVPAAYVARDAKEPHKESARAWPLVIDLHGAYANHRFDLRRVFGKSNRPGETDHEATRNELPLPEVDMIVATAYGRGEMHGYAGLGEADVLDVIAAVERAYRIDPDRVYLTGYSMGGEGTWQIGLHYPDRFAAIVPVCAISDPPRLTAGADGVWDRALLALGSPVTIAENALAERVIFYHGAVDTAVPVADSRAMADRYRALGWLGRNVEYHELPGVDHFAWVPAYADARLFGLLAPIRRDPFPRKVTYRTISPRYRQAYWLRIDAIEHGLAVAEVTGEQDGRVFTVQPNNVAGFSLLLPLPKLPAGRAITVKVGGADVYAGPPAATLSFARKGAAWEKVAAPLASSQPDHAQPGLFGKSLPRTRAHLYVYGSTGDAATTAAARELGERLRDWGDGVKVRFELRRDRDVSDADIAGHDLVLVGGARSNALVARMAARLPIGDGADALVAGSVRVTAADRAYRLVVPNPIATDRRVLIFGADTPAGLAHLDRFVTPGPDPRTPETNTDYLVLDGDGSVRLSGVFRDAWVIGK